MSSGTGTAKHRPFSLARRTTQRGHGTRSSFYSDDTLGVWANGADGNELVPVGKAYFDARQRRNVIVSNGQRRLQFASGTRGC